MNEKKKKYNNLISICALSMFLPPMLLARNIAWDFNFSYTDVALKKKKSTDNLLGLYFSNDDKVL